MQAIQGLPLLGFRCVPIPAFQFALLQGRKWKKGIKYRKEKGKKSITQRTLQRRGEVISYVTILTSTLFLPSSTLACSSPFPVCPCWSFSASFIWKSNINKKKLLAIVRFIQRKKKSYIRNVSLPYNLRQLYSHLFFENCLQRSEFWPASYFKNLSQMATICLNVPNTWL